MASRFFGIHGKCVLVSPPWWHLGTELGVGGGWSSACCPPQHPPNFPPAHPSKGLVLSQ